jgi:hypothetical protein
MILKSPLGAVTSVGTPLSRTKQPSYRAKRVVHGGPKGPKVLRTLQEEEEGALSKSTSGTENGEVTAITNFYKK